MTIDGAAEMLAVHPIFGRLDSRGGYALVAMHFQLHVPQIRQCSGINGEA